MNIYSIFSSSFQQHRALPNQPRDDLSSVSWLCVRLKASWISWVVDFQDVDWLMRIMLLPSLQKNSVNLCAERLFADVHTNSLKITVKLHTVCHIWCETTFTGIHTLHRYPYRDTVTATAGHAREPLTLPGHSLEWMDIIGWSTFVWQFSWRWSVVWLHMHDTDDGTHVCAWWVEST